MTIVVTIILLTISLYVSKETRRVINSLTLFTFFWLLMIWLSMMRLFDLHQTSERAYSIANTGAVFFSIGYCSMLIVFQEIKKTDIIGRNENSTYKGVSSKGLKKIRFTKKANETSLRSVLFSALYVPVIILQLIFLRRVFAIAGTGDLLQVIHRAIRRFDESGIIRTDIERILNNILVQPFLFASIPVSLIMLFTNHKKKVTIFIATSLLSVIYFFTHAGRIILVDYALYTLILASIFRPNLQRKTKRRIAYAGIILLLGVIVSTASRRGQTFSSDFVRDSFLKEAYDYFAIPMPQLSYWIDRIDLSGTHTNGIAFIHGLIELPMEFVEKLGISIDNYREIAKSINLCETEYTNAAYNDMRYNAFVTCFYFFYIDYRMPGVVAGSIAFGVMSYIADESVLKYTDRSIALYLLFTQSLARMYVRWQFYRMNYILAFIYILLLLRRENSTERSKES